MSLNWQNLLTQIRSDIGSFIEQGGWSFLQDFGNEAAESQESEEGSDSNYENSGPIDEESSESDYSGSEADGTDSQCAESSDVLTDSEASGGMDWDEMER